MKKITPKTKYVLVGIALFAAAFPLATDDRGTALHIEPLASVTRTVRQVQEMREDVRLQLKEYAEVQERCDALDQHCPAIYDQRGIRLFMKQSFSATGAALQNVGSRPLELTHDQRELLRKYTRMERCPEILNTVIPGLYELCLSKVHGGATNE